MIIQGQSTVMLEVLDEVSFLLIQCAFSLDYAVIPVGGGGLLAGSCLAADLLDSDINIIGAEPTSKADLFNSLRNNEY